ncbi:MAG: tetratricopeptide repeat protein [Chthoniobacteraceae bacterium]
MLKLSLQTINDILQKYPQASRTDVEGFLMLKLGGYYNSFTASAYLEMDAKMRKWDEQTISAIQCGIGISDKETQSPTSSTSEAHIRLQNNNVLTEEQEQILHIIEMFEQITHSNPDDCESLAVLKEAYFRFGKQKEVLLTGRRLADAYMVKGQYNAAKIEYEDILQKEPNSPEIANLLSEARLNIHCEI